MGALNGVKKFLADLTTEDTAGTIFCYVRVISIVGFVVLMGMAIWSGLSAPAGFDIEKMGRSMAEYLAGVAAAIFGKGKSGE